MPAFLIVILTISNEPALSILPLNQKFCMYPIMEREVASGKSIYPLARRYVYAGEDRYCNEELMSVCGFGFVQATPCPDSPEFCLLKTVSF
jgi:hypothetical protein